MRTKKFRHWRGEKDGEGIYWLSFDKEKSGANVLSRDVLEELDACLKAVSALNPKGLVIISAKKNGFIAGADINEFVQLKDNKSAYELIKRGQSIMDRIEQLPFPTVAAINGFCLGGGMELALACDFRVAVDSPETKLGLPEIKLGIHPGFGGTVRATRLAGGMDGLDMMLTGRMLSVKAAKKLRLVDMAVPARHLKGGARHAVLNPIKRKGLGWKKLANIGLVRPLVANIIKKKVRGKADPNYYPAPYALIDIWEKHADNSPRMYEEEAKSVSQLITGSTAQNLVKVFFLQDRLKSLGGKGGYKAGHAHVVGAGVMGGDIAAWAALRGLKVTLQDREPKYIAPAIKRAKALFEKKLKDKRLVQAAMDRLMPDVKGNGIPKADVIIEAIFENLQVKQELFREAEKNARPDALLATNTSSIPIEDIAEGLKKPERLVGIHFFNPVAQMMLVEAVRSPKTSEKVFNNAVSFIQQIGKLPLPVKSSPGFLVNRILMPYLIEGVILISENNKPEMVDKAAVKFGMPMGPILLADTVGLDICLHVAKILSEDMDIEVPESLEKMVAAGNLGKKSGKGFYDYENGKQKKESVEEKPSEEISERLIFRYLNESVACLREGVVDDPGLLDAGMIFGTGFAPFRGGPMNYISSKGIDHFKKRFALYEKAHGARFKMDEGWKSLFDMSDKE